MVRVTAGVEAHTHEYIATAHEDQKFGFSLAGEPRPARRSTWSWSTSSGPRAARPPLPHRQPDLRHLGLRGGGPPDHPGAARPARPRAARPRCLPELDLGGGFGIAYTTQHDLVADPAELGRGPGRDRRARMRRASASPCRGSRSSPAGPSRRLSTCTLYSVGTVKVVELDGGLARTYVAVDGGMSDNVRTALYDADYSCTLASRSSGVPAVLSRVVGKHCESGDIVVKDEFLPGDVRAGDLLAVPGTGAYCRSMASQYNYMCRGRRSSRCGTGGPGCWSAGRPRTTSSPSTSASEMLSDSPSAGHFVPLWC